jgi:hypothetical protein
MQTRIQLTIFESDRDKLTDISMLEKALEKDLKELPFPVVFDIYHNEPDSSDAKDQPELYSGILIAGDEVMLRENGDYIWTVDVRDKNDEYILGHEYCDYDQAVRKYNDLLHEYDTAKKEMTFQRRYIDVIDKNLVVTQSSITEFTLESIWGVLCDKCAQKAVESDFPCKQRDEYHGDPSFIDGLEDTLFAMELNEIITVTGGYQYLVARIK